MSPLFKFFPCVLELKLVFFVYDDSALELLLVLPTPVLSSRPSGVVPITPIPSLSSPHLLYITTLYVVSSSTPAPGGAGSRSEGCLWSLPSPSTAAGKPLLCSGVLDYALCDGSYGLVHHFTRLVTPWGGLGHVTCPTGRGGVTSGWYTTTTGLVPYNWFYLGFTC